MSKRLRLHPDDIAHLSDDEQDKAIAKQRKDMNLAPWEVCPLEVDDGPSPWPPGTAGAVSWAQAQEYRRKRRKP